MKKTFLLAPLLTLFLFLGCSKDGIDPSDPSVKIDKSANLKGIGASAHDFLSNGNYDMLHIEIAHVIGFRPSAEALAGFEDFLRARTFKEEISFEFTPLSSPNEATLTLKEIDALEKANRSVYTQGRTLGLYIYFADAPADSDKEEENLVTLGAVYRNTSMVIYSASIQKLVRGSISLGASELEHATLNHEFGHLLGLVNLGSPPVNPEHEGSKTEDGKTVGNNHCNAAGCLMRAELQFGRSLMKSLETNRAKGLVAVPQLDAECLADLRANGGR